MNKGLLFCCMFAFNVVLAQAPSWQWAADANSPANETVYDVAYDAGSGNVYAAGSFEGDLSVKYGSSFSGSYGNSDGFLAKYDASGAVVWAIKFGGTGDDEASGLAVDPAGNIYVNGYFRGTADFDPSASTFTLTSAGKKDGFLAKYSPGGALIWALRFGGTDNETSAKMAADANGIYITGSCESIPTTFYSYNNVAIKTTSTSENKLNMFGAKYDVSGIVQWVVSGGGNKDDGGCSVVADANFVYFTGMYESDISFQNSSGISTLSLQAQQNSKPQVFILAATQSGGLSWNTNITTSSGGRRVEAFDLAQDNSGLYITGRSTGNIDFNYPSPAFSQSHTSGNDDDLFLAKLSKAGTFIWRAAATGSGTGDQAGRCVDVDHNGNIILTGHFTSSLNYSSAGGPNLSASGQDLFITSYQASGGFLWSIKAGGTGNETMNGLSVDNAGGIYTGGDHGGAAAFGTYTLGTSGGRDIFLARTGCPAITNNTIAVSQTICIGATAGSLTGTSIGGDNNYLWQVSGDGSNWTNASGTYTSQNYNPPALTITSYYRRNVFASGSCSNIVSNSPVIVITVDSLPDAYAGSNQTICTGSATLAAANPVIGTGTWSLLSGSAIITSSNNATSEVNSLSTGTNSFIWTVSNGSCPSATSVVTIVRDQIPTANAGSSQTLCSTSATLAAINPSAGTGVWSVVSGSALITATNTASTQVSSLSTGTNSFVWTVFNGSCPSATSAVTIVRDQAPVAIAGSDQTVCTSSATLAAMPPNVGTGSWSVLSGSAIIASSSSALSGVTSLSTGTNSFVWTVSNGSCPSASAVVTILRYVAPAANAGSNQTICASSATLAAMEPTAGIGSWSLISGGASITSGTSASSQVTSLSSGFNTFIWTVSNGSCPPAISSVTIVRDEEPTANAGISQTVCASAATLIAEAPAIGTGYWSIVSGFGLLGSDNRSSSQVTSLSMGSNTFLWTVTNGCCPSATAMVTVTRDAALTANAGNDQVVCAPAVTISAADPGSGTGAWSVLSGNCQIRSPNSFTSEVSVSSPGQVVLKWTVKNGSCPADSDEVVIRRDSRGIADAGPDQNIEHPAARLEAVDPGPGVTGRWHVVEGKASLEDPYSATSNLSGLTFGNNVFRWTVSSGTCPESHDDVQIYVKPLMIPNGFSPNGDGINDRFEIGSIDYFSNVKFSVFNRWGTLLYHSSNYRNEWTGTNSGNEKLSDDTYYYTLEIPDYKTFTGFIVLKQNK